ncbi:MAG: IS4 family transposase, partial [Pseudonocardiaceae bacterium]
LGAAPLRALLDLLRGPAAAPATKGVYWRGLLVTAIDGTMMCCPDSPANLGVFGRGGGHHGGTGYPMIRLLALVTCGTRAVIDATFGSSSIGETTYTRDLLRSLHRGMIVLANRNFAAQGLIAAIADTGAELLIRVKNGRKLPVCRRLPGGSYVSRMGPVEVRVIRATVTIVTSAGRRSETYTLVSTLLDPDCPGQDIIGLYHQRWEIETSFLELKSTILGGRVLRARTPGGVDQEIYALLVTYQALRIAITDATITRPGIDPDRGSFTVALNAARDQLIQAAGVIADTAIDLVGVIGHHVLDAVMPARRPRTTPRVVKRAISNYAAKTATGRVHGPSRNTTIKIDILAVVDP